MKPIAVLYEHPMWFQPLFEELDRRSIAYKKVHVNELVYDPGQPHPSFSLLVNRVSAFPSTVSQPEIIFPVQQYLAYLDLNNVPVVNGYRSYAVGTSKVMQAAILKKLGLPTPSTRVVTSRQQTLNAAGDLTFPLLFKPNVGGSGAGIVRFDTFDELDAWAAMEAVDLGAQFLSTDGVGLLQEFLPAQGDAIYRVEILDGEFLYALRVPISSDSFNYCPADGCNVDEPGLATSSVTPPSSVIQEVKQILAASQADIGGVEYLINERSGEVTYYDINPLSNFVANAVNVVGFDPVSRFVDYLLTRVA